jgi:hypothetical protein
VRFEIRRQPRIEPALDARVLDVGPGEFDDAYVLLRDGVPRWQVVTSWGEHRHVPFREELVWESRGLAVIGGGAAVHFLDLETGYPRFRLEIPSLFCDLALDDVAPSSRPDTLYVLGWTDIVAVEPTLTIRWWARDVAVDGLIFQEPVGPVLHFGAEMDPPGGWFDVEIDAVTGRELSRKPAFTEDYLGIYGCGTEQPN